VTLRRLASRGKPCKQVRRFPSAVTREASILWGQPVAFLWAVSLLEECRSVAFLLAAFLSAVCLLAAVRLELLQAALAWLFVPRPPRQS
jgi:hypothetical protein